MFKPAIVIIAYNREKSLERLLKSIAAADYDQCDITLVISIDKSDNDQVLKVAQDFVWEYGGKRILAREENMGLKKHVLSCSELAVEYESAIILEDDLYVSRNFYSYSCQALEFSDKNDKIAGVSLYNHLLNVHVREPFEAIKDGSDGWYFQFASSWGQAYTARQWKAFSCWMKTNDGKDIFDTGIVPENVCSWSDKSWLKYFIRYVIEKDLYFLYPQVSLTTNFSEAGTHSMGQAADLQVPLEYRPSQKEYNFYTLEKSGAVYDAYFENKKLENIENKNAVVDLYGAKPVPETGWLLTGKSLPYKAVKSYARYLRPIDANIVNNIEGNDFFLYDLSQKALAPAKDETQKLMYNYRAFKAKYGLDIIKHRIKEKIHL